MARKKEKGHDLLGALGETIVLSAQTIASQGNQDREGFTPKRFMGLVLSNGTD